MRRTHNTSIFLLFCALFPLGLWLAIWAFVRWQKRTMSISAHRAIHDWRGIFMREVETLFLRLIAQTELSREMTEEEVV